MGWSKIASFDRVLKLLYVELEDMILGVLHPIEPSKLTVGSLSILRVNKQLLKAGGEVCCSEITGFYLHVQYLLRVPLRRCAVWESGRGLNAGRFGNSNMVIRTLDWSRVES
jgi:hypothetical protein